MNGDSGTASSGPCRAVLISNPFLVRLLLKRARRGVRRMPGLTVEQRQGVLKALMPPKGP